MAISVIGGGSTSSSGATTPVPGTKLQAGGFTSTGSYTFNVPGGDYYFLGTPGCSLADSTGSGVFSGTGSLSTSFGFVDNNYQANNGSYAQNPQPRFLRIPTTTSLTFTGGAYAFTSRLGARGTTMSAATWNRNKVLYNSGTYAFADSSLNAVWTSTDAINWTSNATTFAIGNCFMLANGIFFAGDTTNTNILYTSSNGTTWTQRTMPTATVADGKLSAVVYAGGKYVAFFRRGSANTYAVHTFTSTDAVTWTYGAAVTAAPFGTGADNGVFVATDGTTIVVAGDYNVVNGLTYYSTNGTTWTSNGTAAGASAFWAGIEYMNGQFWIYLHSGTPQVFIQTTGQTAWSAQSSFSGLGWGNSSYVSGWAWDGTNYWLTSFTSGNSYSAVYGTTAGGMSTGYKFSGNTGSATVSNTPVNYSVQGLSYANNRFFYRGYSNLAGDGSLYGQLLLSVDTTNSKVRGPGAFALYRAYEQTILN